MRSQVQADERRLLLVGSLALIASLALGALVTTAPASGLDVTVSAWAIRTFESGPARAVFDALNVLGSLESGAVLSVGLAIAFLVARRRGASVAILSTWLIELAGAAVKLVVMRERPPGAVVAGVLGESWAYPSGHVIRAMALVAVLVWLAQARAVNDGVDEGVNSGRAWRAIAAGLVVGFVMGIARLAIGAHWPTDVIGGLFLGTAFGCGFAVVAERLERRQPRGVSGPSPADPPP